MIGRYFTTCASETCVGLFMKQRSVEWGLLGGGCVEGLWGGEGPARLAEWGAGVPSRPVSLPLLSCTSGQAFKSTESLKCFDSSQQLGDAMERPEETLPRHNLPSHTSKSLSRHVNKYI